MKRKQTKTISDLFAEGTAIDQALNQAAQDAVEQHRKADLPLAIWKDGKTVWIQPDEVETTQNGKRSAARRRGTKSRA